MKDHLRQKITRGGIRLFVVCVRAHWMNYNFQTSTKFKEQYSKVFKPKTLPLDEFTPLKAYMSVNEWIFSQTEQMGV